MAVVFSRFRLLAAWPAWTAFLLMGSLVWVLLPSMVITLDDDFWYLRSVIKTLQKGRPWTDEWLTPWAASTSVLSALIFKITGSFTLAIHLELAACAGLAGMGATLFLKRQGISPALSLTATVLLLATPTILFMFLMFTGVALYMACLWWCLLLADRRRWGWFLLPWALAAASRQSAVAWLALPGCALLQEAWTARSLVPRSAVARQALLVLAAAGAILIALKLGMNPTEGQKRVLGAYGQSPFQPATALSFSLGILTGLAGYALACLLRLPGLSTHGPVTHLRCRLALLPGIALLGYFGSQWFYRHTLNTHDCYHNPFSAAAIPLLGIVLGGALVLGAARPRGDALLAGTGAILLVSLYHGQFDYYFVDALCCGLAAGFPRLQSIIAAPSPASHPASPTLRYSLYLVLGLTLLGTAVWHVRSGVRLAVQQRQAAAVITLYEKALRSQSLAPQHVGMATFGYLGWLFQDYYASQETSGTPLVGGFARYAQTWDAGRGTGIITTLPAPLKAWKTIIPSRNRALLRDTPGVPIIAEITHPVLGPWTARFTLFHGPSSDPVPQSLVIDPSRYVRTPFPLNDAEWRHLILESPPLP